jgi:hypothetical protein
LAYGLEGSVHGLVGSCTWAEHTAVGASHGGASSPHGGQEAKRESQAGPAVSPHLLNFPEPPKIMPPAGDKVFNT